MDCKNEDRIIIKNASITEDEDGFLTFKVKFKAKEKKTHEAAKSDLGLVAFLTKLNECF